MKSWTKFEAERLLVARDWTLDLDGAEIIGNPTVTVSGDPALTCSFYDIDGNMTRLWLAGGSPAHRGKIAITVTTSEGEKLSDVIRVNVSKGVPVPVVQNLFSAIDGDTLYSAIDGQPLTDG